jgi:hypothetical protein
LLSIVFFSDHLVGFVSLDGRRTGRHGGSWLSLSVRNELLLLLLLPGRDDFANLLPVGLLVDSTGSLPFCLLDPFNDLRTMPITSNATPHGDDESDDVVVSRLLLLVSFLFFFLLTLFFRCGKTGEPIFLRNGGTSLGDEDPLGGESNSPSSVDGDLYNDPRRHGMTRKSLADGVTLDGPFMILFLVNIGHDEHDIRPPGGSGPDGGGGATLLEWFMALPRRDGRIGDAS